MKTIEAFIEAKTSVETALVAAGLLKGISLSADQIKNATTPIFWFIKLTSKDASEKEIYVTWSITSNVPFIYGDGAIKGRRVSTNVTVFARKQNVDSWLTAIENALRAVYWTFETQSIDFDTGNQMYVYSFTCEAEVSD